MIRAALYERRPKRPAHDELFVIASFNVRVTEPVAKLRSPSIVTARDCAVPTKTVSLPSCDSYHTAVSEDASVPTTYSLSWHYTSFRLHIKNYLLVVRVLYYTYTWISRLFRQGKSKLDFGKLLKICPKQPHRVTQI